MSKEQNVQERRSTNSG